MTVNPLPPTPSISGTLVFCTGGNTTLTSDSASGNQWFVGNSPITGETNQTYLATAAGSYTVQVTDVNGCVSAMSAIATVTVNPLPATPTATPGGATTFCAGGSVTLTSSSASGNQWLLNGNPIGGATNQTYVATAAGSYTVTTTDGNGCTSAPSAAVVVTVNPLPATPTITPGGPTTFCAGGSVTLTSSAASGNQWLPQRQPDRRRDEYDVHRHCQRQLHGEDHRRKRLHQRRFGRDDRDRQPAARDANSDPGRRDNVLRRR